MVLYLVMTVRAALYWEPFVFGICFGQCIMLLCRVRLKTKLEETNPDRVKPFMAGVQEEIKKIMGNMKNFQVGRVPVPPGLQRRAVMIILGHL